MASRRPSVDPHSCVRCTALQGKIMGAVQADSLLHADDNFGMSGSSVGLTVTRIESAVITCLAL